MLEVYLLKQGAQNATELSLPATDYELLDALDKAGINNERDIYHVEVTGSKVDYLPQFIPDTANLYELNLLATRLAALSQWELDCFEGMVMMDTLKTDYITLHPQNWQHHNYVALCGVGGQAMMKMLELNPQIQEVSLCLDNDDAGHKASERLKNQLAESGCQCRRLISQEKDWNDDLINGQQQQSNFEMKMS